MKAVISGVGNKKLTYIKGIFIGVVMGSVVILLLLVAASFLLVQCGNLPHNVISYILLVLDGIGALSGSYVAVRLIKESGILWGAITGFVIFVIVFSAGLMSSTDTVSIYTLIKFIVFSMVGAVGGILAVNKKEKVKY